LAGVFAKADKGFEKLLEKFVCCVCFMLCVLLMMMITIVVNFLLIVVQNKCLISACFLHFLRLRESFPEFKFVPKTFLMFTLKSVPADVLLNFQAQSEGAVTASEFTLRSKETVEYAIMEGKGWLGDIFSQFK
jgi:hypothetical protein